MTADLDISPLRNRGVSEQPIDFLRSMLRNRPEARATATTELQSHPWLSASQPAKGPEARAPVPEEIHFENSTSIYIPSPVLPRSESVDAPSNHSMRWPVGNSLDGGMASSATSPHSSEDIERESNIGIGGLKEIPGPTPEAPQPAFKQHGAQVSQEGESSNPDSGFVIRGSARCAQDDDTDNISIYSVDSVLPASKNGFIEEFSVQLASEIENLALETKLPGMMDELLPDLLKTFAWKLHGGSSNRSERDVSVFLHKHRRSVIDSVFSVPDSARSSKGSTTQNSDDDRTFRQFFGMPASELETGSRHLRVSPKWTAMYQTYPKAMVSLDWDLRQFIEDQEYIGAPEAIFDDIICLTGTSQQAQAMTVSEYMEQTWPAANESIRLLMKRYLSFPNADEWIVAKGQVDFLSDIGEQLGWLGSALRPSPVSEGVVTCSPHFSFFQVQQPSDDGNSSNILASCRINFPIKPVNSTSSSSIGFCWANLFRNPTLVTGYPTAHRTDPNTGVELSLGTMVQLAQSRQFVSLDGNIFLKGFCSLLVATAVTVNVVLWHFLFNSTGDRISYCDSRLDDLSNETCQGLTLRDIETRRHVVGWCCDVRECSGTPQAKIDIHPSNLPPPPKSMVIDKLYVEGGSNLIGGLSISIGKRDKPVYLQRAKSYSGLLDWISVQPVVFYDVEDHRAWLVDGASALLHLVRASIEQDKSRPAYRSKWRFDGTLEGNQSPNGYQSAVEVLGNFDNLNLPLYIDDEIMQDVQVLIDYQAQIAAQDGYWFRQSSKMLFKSLVGFDFWDVAKPSGPIQQRAHYLGTAGHGWIDYVRSVKATTIFDIVWSSRYQLFSQCACLQPPPEATTLHIDPVQLLLPKGQKIHLSVPKLCSEITLKDLGDNGAVVFGHTPYRIGPKQKEGKLPEQDQRLANTQINSNSTASPSVRSNSDVTDEGLSMLSISSVSAEPNAGNAESSGGTDNGPDAKRRKRSFFSVFRPHEIMLLLSIITTPPSAQLPVHLRAPADSPPVDRWSVIVPFNVSDDVYSTSTQATPQILHQHFPISIRTTLPSPFPASIVKMADRVRIRYSYAGIDEFEAVQGTLREIIQEDTGSENWIETRSLPPMGIPPPLSAEAVGKLKSLQGLVVEEINDE
ncbi:hypothetical protein AK830_g2031 [Neonectria ditissima]|uniref:Uncharacterized protein n=1 Tax=Neonectria ditissima TaxID=78410 RepID=A0A0P7BT41_9HYPO|nr:hypothetical protein AK830_g2031 [Neonectria ditissima]